MKPKSRRKRLKRKIKRIAASVAGAAMMSAALLPGLPAATAHASAAPVPEQPYSIVQQVVKTPKGFYTVNKKVPKSAVEQKAAVEQKVGQKSAQKADKPADKEQVKQVKASPAKDKVPETSKEAPSANAKAPADFQNALEVKATAYAPGPHDNEQWGDKTYLGTTVRPGVIAVDPNIIPLGSRVYLEFPDGTGQYAVAEDTGGAIKGNRIDIAMSSVDKAYDFGIKNVKVYVLGKS